LAERFGESGLAIDAREIAARTFELSEFLIDVMQVEDVGAWFPDTVAYHPTCHSLRVLRLHDRPVRLLRAVAELELVELDDSDSCCGFGGTFAIKNSGVSTAMLQDKVDCVGRSKARNLVTADASCLMQIGGGLSRAGVDVRALHLAEVLASTKVQPSEHLHE
jgi:L-lactate dehydrogenase complex protein LldE